MLIIKMQTYVRGSWWALDSFFQIQHYTKYFVQHKFHEIFYKMEGFVV